MNLIQISIYSLVQDLSNDIPSGCITVIGHDLIEKFTICDRTWEKGPLRAQYDFSVQAFLV